MKAINHEEVTKYVENNIGTFHSKRLESIKKIKLKTVLRRKNPYLFKAKNILTSQDLVKTIVDAYLSSQEETIFGDFLEGLAIYINSKVYSGYKSSAEGIDLEFTKEKIHYIVSIKSGPNWGNSSQIRKMKDNFNKAKKILRTSSGRNIHIEAINGCCYGRDNRPDKETYMKYCGQKFWEFISGDKELYLKIIEPLGHKAREKNEEFISHYSQIINVFTIEFNNDFCSNGKINWNKLVEINSSSLF